MDFTLVNLLTVLLVAWLAGALAARLGYPSILGELAAGILLGPAALEVLHPNAGLTVLAEVGVFLLMLYIGIEVDHRELFGASWAGLLAAAGGFTVPAALGYITAVQFQGVSHSQAVFLGIALGVTALVVNSRILVDLKLLGTRVGNVLIAGALISDTVAIVVFAGMIKILSVGSIAYSDVAAIMGKAILFFGATSFLGIFMFPYLWRRLVLAGLTQRTANFTLIMLVALVFAEMAELAGLHAILGAFWAGLFLREEVLMRKLSQDISAIVHDLSIGFLAPIFFVTIGFEVRLDVFHTHLGLLLTVIAAASVGKILGTLLFYLPTGYGWREGLVVGLGMNGRGAVEIIFAGIGLRMGIIDETIFSILVLMAFFTTATVPVLLKWGTNWLRRSGDLVRTDEKRSGLVFVGAGPVARALARELAGSEPVRLIDTNAENCTIAQAEGLTVVQGNALREETLSMVNAGRARALVTLTTSEEVNRFSAELAVSAFGVPEIHVPLGGGRNGHGEPVRGPGLPLFGGHVSIHDWNRWIARREAERVVLAVARPCSPRQFLTDLGAGENVLPLVVLRAGVPALFHSVPHLHEGDHVVLLQRQIGKDLMESRLDRILHACPILDLAGAPRVEDFFARVAELLADRVGVPAQALLGRLLERERDSSTVILPTVAIPHIIIEGEHRFEVLIARCREGIQFADPGARVRMVFVIVGSKDERNFHLRTLSTIGQLFQQPDFEEKWMGAGSEEDLRHLILSSHRRRT